MPFLHSWLLPQPPQQEDLEIQEPLQSFLPCSAQVLLRQEYLVVPEQSLQEEATTWLDPHEVTPLQDELPPETQDDTQVYLVVPLQSLQEEDAFCPEPQDVTPVQDLLPPATHLSPSSPPPVSSLTQLPPDL